MKRNFFALLLAFCLLLLPCGIFPQTAAQAATEGVAECVVEVTSRRFLHEKNAEERLPMASTTKILTAIVVIEDCDLEEVVSIPQEAEGTEGSSVYLKAGEEYTVRDLLYGLMLRSGNDCAVTLALHHSESIDAFAKVMTARAGEMGAEHSQFLNPHGLPAREHYTTARDLALIAAYAMQNSTFREIVGCPYYAPRGWKNKNKMLTCYEGATGVKTGFTTAAGRCLVTSAVRNGMPVVSVLLNCPDTYARTCALLDDVYSRYQMIPLLDASQPFRGYAVKRGFAYPLTKEELAEIRIDGVSAMPLPETTGEVAGQVLIYLGNRLLFSENLYIM